MTFGPVRGARWGEERNRQECPFSCAHERLELAGCESLSRSGLDLVIEGNCVAERRGGKQPEVNDRSVGNKLDSACCRGELARKWRSPMSAPTHWKGVCCSFGGIAVSPDENFRPYFWDGKGWLETERSEGSKTLSEEIRNCVRCLNQRENGATGGPCPKHLGQDVAASIAGAKHRRDRW